VRRLLWAVVGVLVLGAWTCAPVDDGSDPVAGPTTTGLAALIGGEDWHYVGEAGEPAFENSWGSGQQAVLSVSESLESWTSRASLRAAHREL
jgi:hypothetical protein